MFGPQLPFFKLDRLKKLFGVLPRLPIRGREGRASHPARRPLLEYLEDRLAPATVNLVGSDLLIKFTNQNEIVTVSNNGTQIIVNDQVNTFPNPAANVNHITVQDPSNLPGQSLTFVASNPLNLSNGIDLNGAESVAINNAITSGNISINTTNLSSNSNGTITLSAGATFGTSGAGALTGAINGPGSVTYGGTGQLLLSGNNNYSGGTSILSGMLVAATASALGTGSVSVTNQGSLGLQGGITLNNAINIDTSGPVGGIVNVSGNNTIQGAINANGNGALKIDVPTATGSLIIAGTFSGTASVSKTGQGTLTYNGSSKTYTKDTTIDGGTLVANVAVSSANMLVNNGGTLAGSGPLGAVRAFGGGTIAPGTGAAGKLDSGPLSMFSSSVLKIDLNGTTPTSQYDQLNVFGAVNLNADGGPGPTLDVTIGGFTPPANSTYTIINNDGGAADPVLGNFANLPPGGTLTVGTSTFRISYSGGDGNDVVLTALGPINNPPVAQPGSLNTAEDTAKTGTLQATDSDSAALTYSIVDMTNAHGTVTITPGTNTYTYTPDQDYNGPASFTFQANDGNSNSNTATISITVTPVNDAPTGVNDSLSTVAEDSGARTIAFTALTGNDIKGPTNESSQNLTITAVSGAVGGAVSIVAPNVIFTPTADFNGVASFSYTLSDDGTTNGTPDPKTSTAVASFTITEVNDAPTGVNDTLTSITEDSSARTIAFTALTGNDIKGPANENGQSLTITAVSGVVGGTVSIVSPNLIFTPAADFNGVASFTYTLADDGTTNGAADPKTSTAVASFTITEVNDAPTGVNDNLTSIPQNSSARTIPFATLTANDFKGPANESAQNLTITAVSGAVGGTVSISFPNVVFTPTANFNGPASFTYTLADDGTTNGAPDPKISTALVTFNITAVNTAPVASDGTLTTFEDTPATGILVANDADGGALTYSIVTPPTTAQGTVALTGIAPGAYSFTPAPDFNGTASFTFKANDGALDSTPATITITVIPVNDAPTAVNDSLSSIAEDSAARTIAFTALTGNDIKGPANENGQNLTITAVSGAVGGTLSITSTAVIFTPAVDFNGLASFTYTLADDGTTNGAPDPKTSAAIASFTITEVNDAPTGVNDSLPNSAEDSGARTIAFTALTGNDIKGPANEGGQNLTITAVSGAVGGTVSIFGSNVIFTPTPEFNGLASFTYTLADDGTTNGAPDPKTSTALASFTITEVNDAPTGVNDPLSSIPQNSGPRTIPFTTLTANDLKGPANESAQNLTITAVSGAVGGTVSISGTNVIFTPAANFSGPASFTYTLTDDGTTNGAPDPKISTAVVSFNVIAVNIAPVASNVTLTTPEDTLKTGFLSATDADSSALTYAIVTPPGAGQGTVTITNPSTGAFSFTPGLNFNGTATFTFKANDGALDSNVATVSITVTPVNDAPIAADDRASTPEDTPLSGKLSAIDFDNNLLTYTIVAAPSAAQGTVTITNSATGAFSFTPAPNFFGAATFTFKVNDGQLDSNVATMTIDVSPVNDAPVAVNGTQSTPPGATVTGTLVANDVDSTNLTYSIVAPPNSAQGTAAITNATTGAYSFTPTPNFTGTATFTFKANDGALDSNIATITINVTSLGNKAPVASIGVLTTAEDTPATGTLTATDSDGDKLTFSIVNPPSATQGAVAITNPATGAYNFTPAPNFNGQTSFTFKANDGIADSNVATITITVTPVNDAPAANNGTLSTLEDTPATGTLSATDIDGDKLTYSIVSQPGATQGTVSITDSTTGAYRYTPAPNFNGPASFTFKVNDGKVDSNVATITITVTSVNDAPVANIGALTTAEDTQATGTLVATDVDVGDKLTYTIVTPPAATQGTVAITNPATGAYSFTPAQNFNGQASFSFKANDGTVDSNVATISITVTSVNDAPVAKDSTLNASLNSPATGTLLATDVDSPTLTYSIVSQANAKGTVTITNAATGTYSYTPVKDFTGIASFTFKANDGAADSNIATVTITVSAGTFATATVVTRTVGANPSIYGDSLTFTAAVTNTTTAAAPTGFVDFFIDNATTPIAKGVPLVLGAANTSTASFTISALSAATTPHAITAVYAANGNFTASQGNLAGGQSVNPKPLTVSGITGVDKIYDGTTVAQLSVGNAALVGVVNGDLLTLQTANAVGAFVDKNVGTAKTVTISGLTISGAASGNYVLLQPTTTANITPKAASVTPNDATKVVGTADPVLTGTLAGFVPTDNVTATYSRAPGETVQGSPYVISVAALSPQSVLGNYNITRNTGKFTITPVATADVVVGVVGDRLQVNIVTPGRTVLVTTINGITSVSEQSIGVRSFPTSSFSQFNAADLTNSAGSTLTFAGNSLLTLPGGLTSNAIDNVAFNSPISTTTLSITAKNVTSGANGRINVSTSATLNVSDNFSNLLGDINGTGSFTKDGPGTLILAGNNGYTGVTNVNSGVLVAPTSLALGSTAGVKVASGATLSVRGKIALNAPLNLSGAGVGGVGALNNMLDNNTFAGPITLAADTVIGSESGILTLPGVISGAAKLTKTGPGRVVLSGDSTYTGVTNINQGQLIVNGSLKNSPVVNINNGGLLGGTGTVGTINALSGGKVSPGNSPGKNNSGNLNMFTGSTMIMDINGTIVGSGYDQVNVNGNVDLDADNMGGATLDVELGYTPVIGDKFIIINNDGTDPIVNDFAGMPQGSIVNVSGASLYISYTGGDGNDVELTVVSPTDLETATTLTATPQHTTGGMLILLTATVTPFPGVPDFGTVTFSEEGTAFSDGIDIPLSNEGQALYTWGTTTATPTGPHLLCAEYSGAAGFLPSSDTETVTLDEASLQPQLVSVGLNGNLPAFMTPGGQGQHSRIVNLVVTFDRPVQLDLPGAFTMSLHTLNVFYDGASYPQGYDPATLPLPALNAAPSNGNRTWTITFSGNSAVTGQDGYNSLPDGVFDFTVHGANVHPQGAPTVNMGGDNTSTFHCLFGDTTPPTGVPNGSGGTDFTAVVNSGDNLSFRAAFNSAPNYHPYLDVNGSGTINSGDNLQFRGNFNHTLKWTV